MTSTSKTAMSQTIVDNRLRYAKKSPEEQKSAKFSQVVCLNEDTCSSGTDSNANLPGEANPHRLSQNRTNLKKLLQVATADMQEAHMAHKEMCGKAVKMMSEIERILDKFDSDSSDED